MGFYAPIERQDLELLGRHHEITVRTLDPDGRDDLEDRLDAQRKEFALPRVLDSRLVCRVGCRVQGAGCRVQGVGWGVDGSRLGVGCRVLGWGLRVYFPRVARSRTVALGFRV